MKHFQLLQFAAAVLICCIAHTVDAGEFFVAPMGDDQNDGSLDHPFATIQRAQESVSPGDTVFIRGGAYLMDESQISRQHRIWAHVIQLDKSGSEGKRINYWAYEDERPIFDFSAVKPRGKRVHAFSVSGSWLHVRGIEVVGVQVTIATHTQSISFANDGSHNIYERLSMHDSMAIGIYSVRGSDNLFLNCDAYRNYDSFSERGRGGNTDGFGCHPTQGDTGNVFRGCRAWLNSDDGFDCISASEAVTFDNCWAMENGYSVDFKGLADGNGFKVGGYGSTRPDRLPDPIPHHVVKDCIAVRNKNSGFYANHHPGGSAWIGNAAYRNGANFNMLCRLSDNVTDVAGYAHELRDNISYDSRGLVRNLNADKCELSGNTFNSDVRLRDADFASLDATQLKRTRLPTGELPPITFLQPYLDRAGSIAAQGAAAQPAFLHLRAPEGSYRVTITFGNDERASCTSVKAELRRWMLESVCTSSGETLTKSFIVNVRTPQISGGGRVRLKAPRETVDEAWAWDGQLTLEFTGERPSVRSVDIEAVSVPTLYLLGDSTVCDQPQEPYASWGQMLTRFVRPGFAVANHAESGESLASSQSAGRLDKVLAELKPGDYVLIQFGHNDMKSKQSNASEKYAAMLTRWVRQIRDNHGTPVLITPMHRHRFEADQVVDTLEDYPDRVRQVASDEDVALVDLNAMSKILYEKLGPEDSAMLFKHDFPGAPTFDHTHHNSRGAYELAKLVAEGLRKANINFCSE